MESFPNDLINDTLARLSMRLKILFEEDYVKMLEKKKGREEVKIENGTSQEAYTSGKKWSDIERGVKRERGGGSRYLERIRFYCQHEHKLQKNTFGRGVARTPSRIEAIYERRLSKYP